MNDMSMGKIHSEGDSETRQIAGDVVAAYLSNNSMRPEEVADFIKKVRAAFHEPLAGRGAATVDGPAESGGRLSDVEYRKVLKATVFDDGIVSLENGVKYKTLRRHIGALGMTIEGYREKHGLHGDYPTVCKDYTKVRSGLAKSIGLGRRGKDDGEGAGAGD